MAEAGTGVGKSLAYLIPALASGLRVVVATATKALQEQLLRNDVPIAAAALHRDVRVEVLKGRQNYLCRRQLSGFQPMLLAEGRDGRAWEAMQGWLGTTETGDRAELEIEPSDALWAELAVGADRCSGRRCPFHGDVFRRGGPRPRLIGRPRDREPRALLRRSGRRAAACCRSTTPSSSTRPTGSRSPPRRGSAAGVSRAGLRRLALDLERACRERQETLPARALDRVERAGERLLARRRPADRPPAAARSRRRRRPCALGDALAALALELQGHGEELDGLARRCAAAWPHRSRRSSIPTSRNGSSGPSPGAIAWAPVDVSTELRDRLWEDGPTAVLVSATLTAGEDARFVRRRLGLDQAREAVVGSPYDFGEQALLYLPQAMPDPRSDEFIGRAAEEIVSLLALSEGRALVLTSSYRALDAYRDRIRGRVPYDVLVQGEAPRERLLERFRDEVGSVLLATSTFWQGVDVPGESLSLLVIDKLPFSAPGDPLHEARCEAVERARRRLVLATTRLPTAMLQLRQGFGRLIRGHSDRGVVAILDPRLRTRAYGRAFLAALPRCPIADDPAAVAAFFGELVGVSA